MRSYLKITIFILTTLSAFKVNAQQNLTLYTMPIQQAQAHCNPAFVPSARINIAMMPLLPPFAAPSIYMNMSNSGFKLHDLVTLDTQGKTYFDFDNMLSKLKPNNYLTSSLQIDVLTFGFKLKKNYFSFNASEKLDIRFRYPKDFMNVLVNGNGANGILGNEQKFNFGLDAVHYTDLGIGYNRELLDDKLTIGGRVKYLIGHENIYTKRSDISLTTGTQNFDLTAKSDIAIYTSGLAKDTTRSGYNFFNTKNSGIGLDLGGVYKLTDKIILSASVLDIGYIKWTDRTQNFISANPEGSVTFSGVDLKSYINDTSDIAGSFANTLDSIKKEFQIVKSHEAYKTNLSSKIYIGAKYKLSDKFFAGATIYTQIAEKKLRPALCLSFNAKFTNWFSATVSYSILNRSYNNVGLGLILNPGWFQWYIITDNILGPLVVDKYGVDGKGISVPAYTKNLNLRVGFNLTIGKKAKDNTPAPQMN